MAEKMVVGLVGWRGMVGSVLMSRMVEEGDFQHITPVFFQPAMLVVKHQVLMVWTAVRSKMQLIS